MSERNHFLIFVFSNTCTWGMSMLERFIDISSSPSNVAGLHRCQRSTTFQENKEQESQDLNRLPTNTILSETVCHRLLQMTRKKKKKQQLSIVLRIYFCW